MAMNRGRWNLDTCKLRIFGTCSDFLHQCPAPHNGQVGKQASQHGKHSLGFFGFFNLNYGLFQWLNP